MCLYNYLASATYSRPLKITSLQDELASSVLNYRYIKVRLNYSRCLDPGTVLHDWPLLTPTSTLSQPVDLCLFSPLRNILTVKNTGLLPNDCFKSEHPLIRRFPSQPRYSRRNTSTLRPGYFGNELLCTYVIFNNTPDRHPREHA